MLGELEGVMSAGGGRSLGGRGFTQGPGHLTVEGATPAGHPRAAATSPHLLSHVILKVPAGVVGLGQGVAQPLWR